VLAAPDTRRIERERARPSQALQDGAQPRGRGPRARDRGRVAAAKRELRAPTRRDAGQRRTRWRSR
jgi:hypothetical protein